MDESSQPKTEGNILTTDQIIAEGIEILQQAPLLTEENVAQIKADLNIFRKPENGSMIKYIEDKTRIPFTPDTLLIYAQIGHKIIKQLRGSNGVYLPFAIKEAILNSD